MATEKFVIAAAHVGVWREMVEGPDVYLVSGNDNWTYCYGATAPTDPEIDGHACRATEAVRAAPLEGERFWVRALRPMRFSLTPEA